MKKKLSVLFLCGIMAISAGAQGRLFENWGAGINVGLYGIGVQGATSLNPFLTARAGFDYLGFSYNGSVDFSADVMGMPGVTLDGDVSDFSMKFPNFKAMIDFYPVPTGIFSITAGLYIGSNRISADGMVHNYYLYPNAEFGFEDIIIRPNPDGSFGAKLKLGNVIKPYLGIGIGRTIPKESRIGFRFELGLVYQGKMKLESDNISDAGLNLVNDAAELDVPKGLLEFWPMMNFSLTYRIK